MLALKSHSKTLLPKESGADCFGPARRSLVCKPSTSASHFNEETSNRLQNIDSEPYSAKRHNRRLFLYNTRAHPAFASAVEHRQGSSGLQEPSEALDEPERRSSWHPEAEASTSCGEAFCVVNFYHLTDVEKPHELVGRHRRWLEGRDIQGRIYISSQGINAQLSGPETTAHAYATWASEQDGFQVKL